MREFIMLAFLLTTGSIVLSSTAESSKSKVNFEGGKLIIYYNTNDTSSSPNNDTSGEAEETTSSSSLPQNTSEIAVTNPSYDSSTEANDTLASSPENVIETTTLKVQEHSTASGSSLCRLCTCTHLHTAFHKPYYNISCTLRGISEIPESLPQYIDVLDLSHNSLKEAAILQNDPWVSVKKLFLNRNNIKIIAEPDFYHVEGVQLLDLSYNSIIDIIGNPFAYLKELRELDLSGNVLRELPQGVFRSLTEMRTLKLSRNPLHRLSSNMVSIIPSLLYLDLSYTALSDLGRDTFKGCDNLQTLDLSWNNLEIIPTRAFRHTDQLEYLKLTGNPVQTIDERSFWYSANLFELYLDYMPELRAVRAKSFSKQKQLIKVNISNNKKLTTVDARAFKNVLGINDIDLSNNQLSNVENGKELSVLCADTQVKLHGNPWECDCNLKWILSCVAAAANDSLPKCALPQSNEGTPIFRLSEDKMICEDTIYLVGIGLVSKKVGVALLCLGIAGVLISCCGIVFMVKIRPRVAWIRRIKDKDEDVYYVRMKDKDPDETPASKY